ncbi:MAG: hypothetical protein IKI03_02740 [Clostridia bacterium]|nr:hypothetical protein [Clostridia bacterium]
MKRFICLLIASVFVLGGCAGGYVPHGGNYSLSDGRYVTSTSMPYLLLGEGRFTVVKDIAVSYQPSGTVRRDGNSVVLEGVFADADFRYSFVLTSDDTLLFDLGASILPMSAYNWNDGMIFTLADDTANDTDDGLDRIEQVEGVPPEFVNIVMENRFKDVAAFSDRLLKVETVSYRETLTAEHKITMTDLYGEPLAVYTVSSDDAYYVSALTATEDGGFLFVLGFNEYSESAANRDEHASRIIKCDKNGDVVFDTPLNGIGGDSLEYCFEKYGRYYFFGDDYVPDVRNFTQTDVFMGFVNKDGSEFGSARFGGGDYAHLLNVEETDDGFLLYVDAISPSGDFSSGVPAATDWTVAVNSQLEVTAKSREPGRDYNDRRIGEREGKPVFRSDPVFDGFDAGLPTAFIDYDDFYLIVSEHVTGEYENTPPYISAIWNYTETVYSGYDGDGNLLFRASIDSSPDYDSMTPGLLQRTYPEYFGLDASGGLDVIVWQMSEFHYYFGLLEHSETERDWLDHELMDLSTKGVDAATMREILSTYNVGEDDIHIVPWQNPFSSYIPLVFMGNMTEEERAEMTERYIEEIREMLLG